MTKVAIVAGESSGDQLGAELIRGLRSLLPDVEIYGMCGPKMRAEGCTALADIEELSVMGLAEVLRKYPSLRKLRARLTEDLIALRADVFIGIDVPDFVHYIERKLKDAGTKTVHYVAPQVWAWRPQRAKSLSRAIDLLLVLFPFEPKFFSDYGIQTQFVGHPLVNKISENVSRNEHTESLGLAADKRYIAMMPGSRKQELRRHTALFCDVTEQLARIYPDAIFLFGAVHDDAAAYIEAELGQRALQDRAKVVVGNSHAILGAADLGLVVSGTVTMEALLSKTPIVVAIRLAKLSHFILKRLVTTRFVAMPNILAQTTLVPEFVQNDATVENLVTALGTWLDDAERVADFGLRSNAIRKSLQSPRDNAAANAIVELAFAGKGS
ncbi:MAG: lipid-A-disaccharide synthase [Pseudomonadota bacterium]